MLRTAVRVACLFALLATSLIPAFAQTSARCGQGWLEEVNGLPVLHLKGTPYEMGYQHGALLKEHVRGNLDRILNVEGDKTLVKFGPIEVKPRDAIQSIIEIQKPFVPQKFIEEIAGLAAGAGINPNEARVANFIPEMFHCSGFALMNSATKDGTLYHGRVLDYAIDWGLQDHAVVIVCEPEGAIPFVNVSYAGFVGCVTGMNAEHVSIGEMGGGGLGHWNGVPMAFLVRDALERGKTIEDVLTIYRETPRTCQYFYVVADAKTNKAVGMEASWDVMTVIEPGQADPRLPRPVKDCALLSAGDRYQELVNRVEKGHGEFTPESALRLMDMGVAMKSNLHNVLFEPKSTKFWVSNATSDKKPAAEQPYHAFQLSELLKRKPDMSSPELPMAPQVTSR
ncbi:Acyl-coenzyme A:6-aminopenicillanic acid acyl-transferase [Caulifigura coniformis]|uniref:Acyl-coenzyme A:6-aminopenicillanic acid acyl-transferase n=1 Tax=Caulifigura coniformis TaxID=2527983 RepID=A0A517SB47_9PLAN|nr:C45 family peptidase [Caulifigura coniformis]QDT53348.1 Acyl-coenzyme A:6-aminopenicillanic acid acyl-transferase [Caulifigura coniformis]